MIFILDDNETDIDLIISGLRDFNIKAFTDTDKFLEEYQEEYISVIDYKLNHGKTGLEVLKYLKEIYPKSKCIIMSGTNNTDLTKEFMKAGANDFVFKDYKNFIRDLGDAIKRLLCMSK